MNPGEAAGLRTSCVAPVGSDTAVGGVGAWANTWLPPSNNSVGAELTLPTNIIGAVEGLGMVTDAAVELRAASVLPGEIGGGSEVDSFAAA